MTGSLHLAERWRPLWLRRLGLVAVVPLSGSFVLLAACLHLGTPVLNVSHSLDGAAFMLFERPRVVRRGAVALVRPPEAYAAQFGEGRLVKRIAGLPGDAVRREGDAICFPLRCVEAARRLDGALFGSLLAEGRIPEGRVALLGDAGDSLDSRYASVGLWPREDILATGFTIPDFLLPGELVAWSR